VAEIAAALGRTAGALDKIALDITLLSQTEVGEVAEGGEGRRGGSSTMPQKRNPVGSVLVRACARQAQGNVEILMRAMGQEHERAAGAWHAEWQALAGALAFTGGAAAWLAGVMEGLEVRPERMRENLDATRGLVMAERVSLLLAERMGRDEAHELIRSLSRRTERDGGTLREALLADADVLRHLTVEQIEDVMNPATYLGSTPVFDRALALHRALSVG
jgi:3-carboxy-cis,cis-muconate cycloisomerase